MLWLIQLECAGCCISYSNQHEQMNWLKISMSINQLIIFRLKCMLKCTFPGFLLLLTKWSFDWHSLHVLCERGWCLWKVGVCKLHRSQMIVLSDYLWAKLQPTSFKRFSAVWNSFQQSGKRKKFSRAGLSSMCCMINFSLAKSNKNDLPVEVLHSY